MCHIHFYWPFSCPFMLFLLSYFGEIRKTLVDDDMRLFF
jgi:hypothetical protein